MVADAGYCSEANLEAMDQRKIDAYVATGRAKYATAEEVEEEAAATTRAAGAGNSTQEAPALTRVEAMREKLMSGGYASPYRLCKQLPEPVFGQERVKIARRSTVRCEWALACTAHNLLKLILGRSLSAARKTTEEAVLARLRPPIDGLISYPTVACRSRGGSIAREKHSR
jgi:hypothetical protein